MLLAFFWLLFQVIPILLPLDYACWTILIVWFYNIYYVCICVTYYTYQRMKHLKKIRTSYNKWRKNFDSSQYDCYHLIVICACEESVEKIKISLDHLTKQTYKEKIIIVLATEECSPAAEYQALLDLYKGVFHSTYRTVHEYVPGEVKHKCANENYAVRHMKKHLVDQLGMDVHKIIVTIADFDTYFPHIYFEYLSVQFYTKFNKNNRLLVVFQSDIFYYMNDNAASFVRWHFYIVSGYAMAFLFPSEQMCVSVYSASLALIDRVNYWDTSIISEDERFWNSCIFHTKGKVLYERLEIPIVCGFDSGETWRNQFVSLLIQKARWWRGSLEEIKFTTTTAFVQAFQRNQLPKGKAIKIFIRNIRYFLDEATTLFTVLYTVISPSWLDSYIFDFYFFSLSFYSLMIFTTAFYLMLCLIVCFLFDRYAKDLTCDIPHNESPVLFYFLITLTGTVWQAILGIADAIGSILDLFYGPISPEIVREAYKQFEATKKLS